MNIDGTNQRLVFNNHGNVNNPVYSPDGNNIIFSDIFNKSDRQNIYSIDVYGKNLLKLTNGINDIKPIYSNKGIIIAFLSLLNNNYQIYLMQSDGSKKKQLTNLKSGIMMMCFSPDGKQIYYVSPRINDVTHHTIFPIYVINVDGTGQKMISRPDESCFAPNLVPYGNKLLYVSVDSNCKLYSMNFDGTSRSKNYICNGLTMPFSCWPYCYSKNVP